MKKGFWIVVALLIASVAMNVWFWQTVPEPSIVIERDTVWKDSIIREPLSAETIEHGARSVSSHPRAWSQRYNYVA